MRSLQEALAEERVVVEEKKAATLQLIESIGRERAVVDDAVEASRADEEAAAALQAEVIAFQNECAADLASAEPIIKVRRGAGHCSARECAAACIAGSGADAMHPTGFASLRHPPPHLFRRPRRRSTP